MTSNGNFLICCQEKIISQTKMARIGIHAVSSLNPHPCGFLLNIMQHIRKYHHSSSGSLRNVTIHFSYIKILRLNCYRCCDPFVSFESEQVQMGVCVGNASFGGITDNGPDGSRTRVRRPIPCTSTSVVCSFTFPP